MSVEEQQAKKGLPGESYTFDLIVHPYYLDMREKVEANPHEHMVYDGLRRLSGFLLRIDDYDLVRKVCQIEETDYEHKGIGTLYGLPGVPRIYTSGEEYQAFLSHIEKLMGIHLIGRGEVYSVASSFYREEQYKHPYPLLLYALALVPLGSHARSIGHAFLDYAQRLERNCPGFVYVLGVYQSADLFYRGWEEQAP